MTLNSRSILSVSTQATALQHKRSRHLIHSNRSGRFLSDRMSQLGNTDKMDQKRNAHQDAEDKLTDAVFERDNFKTEGPEAHSFFNFRLGRKNNFVDDCATEALRTFEAVVKESYTQPTELFIENLDAMKKLTPPSLKKEMKEIVAREQYNHKEMKPSDQKIQAIWSERQQALLSKVPLNDDGLAFIEQKLPQTQLAEQEARMGQFIQNLETAKNSSDSPQEFKETVADMIETQHTVLDHIQQQEILAKDAQMQRRQTLFSIPEISHHDSSGTEQIDRIKAMPMASLPKAYMPRESFVSNSSGKRQLPWEAHQ